MSEELKQVEGTGTPEEQDRGGTSRKTRKTRVGVVVSDKMQKTIVVEVATRVPHSTFKKIVKRTKRLYVHDDQEQANVGDKVLVEETRPLSKTKCWRLVEVLAK